MSLVSPNQRWSPSAAAIWGKTNSDDDSWLPLWRHLEDSAHVAGLLWDHWLPLAAKRHVAASLDGDMASARRLLVWLAGVHDIGKATPAFAVKALTMHGRLLDSGLDLGVPLAESRRAPHGALGFVVIDKWLEERFPSSTPRAREALAVVVGAHHGVMPDGTSMAAIAHRADYRGGRAWESARAELLDAITEQTGATAYLPQWLAKPLPPTMQALLAGVIVVADWLASDETRFGYGDRHESATWDDLGLPSPWQSTDVPRDPGAMLAARFPALTGCEPTAIQAAAVNAAWSADRPPLIILEAEMGSGKTEAGLAAADVLAHRFGMGGVFMALPTMATSDAMFGRVRDWIEALPGEGSLSMYLAHGKAGLNDSFRGLPDDRHFAGLYDDDSGDVEMRHAVATVNAWTRGRRKGVLAPFVVGTIDQVLFGALRSRHLGLRHLALATKVVVIDEVHAADTYMREYLSSMLTWLGAYGTPVVLMSATLPSAQRQQLVNAYARGASTCPLPTSRPSPSVDMPEQRGYPRTLILDSTCRDIPTAQVASRPRTVEIEEIPDGLDELVDRLAQDLSGGGCVAVIRNTVSRAQETYTFLRDHLDEVEVVLVHSRFLAVDRAAREADLRSRLGRGGKAGDGTRPQRLVVVGTQVLEQSLDIDVDLMVSDLAPMDLLFQRAGRLHRHTRGLGESDRPAAVRQPRLLVGGVEWSSAPVTPVKGSRRVYGESALLRAAATLRRRGHRLRLPDDIPSLVEEAYDPTTPPPPGWEDAWTSADETQHLAGTTAADRAQTFLLGRPQASAGLLARSGFFIKGDPDDGNGGRSQVRDSEDGLEVVVVRRADGVVRPMPGAGLPEDTVLATDFAPEPRIARALAGCTVRLPSWSTRSESMDAVISALEEMSFAGWQRDCPWLEGQLVLVLDEAGHARVAHLDVEYCADTGLLVTTPSERS